jgi:hypothetical protein
LPVLGAAPPKRTLEITLTWLTLALAAFLVIVPKTPGAFIFVLFLVFVFGIYPSLYLIPTVTRWISGSKTRRKVVLAAWFVAVVFLGAILFPRTEPPSAVVSNTNLVLPSDTPEGLLGADVWYKNTGANPLTALQYGFMFPYSERQMTALEEGTFMRNACQEARSQERNKNHLEPGQSRLIRMRLQKASEAVPSYETIDRSKAQDAAKLGRGYLYMFAVLRYQDAASGRTSITGVCHSYHGDTKFAQTCESGHNGVYADACDMK